MSVGRRGIAWGAVLLAACAGCAGCAERATPDRDLTQVAEMMAGSFSSAEQAAADSTYYDIRLHMVRIWPEHEDGCWLYVEQVVAEHPEKPYRQRVYHVTRASADTLESAVFLLPAPEEFVGAWRNPEVFAPLSPDSLTKREGCSVFLGRVDEDTFAGGTHGIGCGSTLRGATYATSEVTVHPDRLLSWDRGFAADGNQVWGATAGGYVFRREAVEPR